MKTKPPQAWDDLEKLANSLADLAGVTLQRQMDRFRYVFKRNTHLVEVRVRSVNGEPPRAEATVDKVLMFACWNLATLRLLVEMATDDSAPWTKEECWDPEMDR